MMIFDMIGKLKNWQELSATTVLRKLLFFHEVPVIATFFPRNTSNRRVIFSKTPVCASIFLRDSEQFFLFLAVYTLIRHYRGSILNASSTCKSSNTYYLTITLE